MPPYNNHIPIRTPPTCNIVNSVNVDDFIRSLTWLRVIAGRRNGLRRRAAVGWFVVSLTSTVAALCSNISHNSSGPYIPALVDTNKLEQHPELPDHANAYVCYPTQRILLSLLFGGNGMTNTVNLLILFLFRNLSFRSHVLLCLQHLGIPLICDRIIGGGMVRGKEASTERKVHIWPVFACAVVVDTHTSISKDQR